MGVFELAPFAAGTRTVADAVAACARRSPSSVAATARRRSASSASPTGRPREHRRRRVARVHRAGRPPRLRALRERRHTRLMATDRKPIIAGNWKMHHDHLEAIQVVQKLVVPARRRGLRRASTSWCARRSPTCARCRRSIEADKLEIGLGAQNCHWEDQGAFTGEVSPLMLAKLNVQYVIVGHSERRQLFGETDEIGQQEAARRCSKHGMTPIVCVGETLEEREAGATAERVTAADRRRVRGREGGRRGRLRRRLRTDLGDRHRPQRHARRRQRDHRRHPRRAAGAATATTTADARPHPVRRQREAGQRRRRSWRCPRSTAPSSAARRSTPTSSPGSCQYYGAECDRGYAGVSLPVPR